MTFPRHKRYRSCLLALAIAAVLVLLAAAPDDGPGNGKLQIHYIDVGQGDASLIITPGGTTLAIDTGPSSACDHVVDYYKDLGVQQLDYLLSTHYHADHIGCVPELLDEFPLVGPALDRGGSFDTNTFEEYREAVGDKRQKARPNDPITLEKVEEAGEVVLDVVVVRGDRGDRKLRVPSSEENDLGVVAVLRAWGFDATFGGDISGEDRGSLTDIESFVASDVGKVEVYKVHHHGSKTSTSSTWVRETRPIAAIFSMGANNSFKHPRHVPVKRLHRKEVNTYWTTKGNGRSPDSELATVCGDTEVVVRTNGNSFVVRCSETRKKGRFDGHPPEEDEGDDGDGGDDGAGGGDDDDEGDDDGGGDNDDGDDGNDGDDGDDDDGGGDDGMPEVEMCLSVEDEEVHITNRGSSPLNLANWVLRDQPADPHKFTFIQDRPCRPSYADDLIELMPGDEVIVTSGRNPVDAPPVFLAGWCNFVWDNEGDQARLFDPSGKLVKAVNETSGSCP